MKVNVKKINAELERAGWSRAEYARQVGVTRQLMDYYLNGEVKGFRIVEVLARPFGMDPKDLLI